VQHFCSGVADYSSFAQQKNFVFVSWVLLFQFIWFPLCFVECGSQPKARLQFTDSVAIKRDTFIFSNYALTIGGCSLNVV
jgi:hypothetical protein